MTKVAIITGGNSGLGFATANKFANEGYLTYIIGRNREKTIEAAQNIGENGRYRILDLVELDQIPKLISDIYSEARRIDVLVNNAGLNMKKDMLEVTDLEFFNIINVNVLSVFSISREVAKIMKEQKSGSIVNISSMAAQYALPKVTAYTASKTAIDGMTRSMAMDLAEYGIRVNAVAPGFIKTPMTDKALNSDPTRKKRVLSRTPMGRMGEPSHISDAVYYMASDAASFVTGQILCVDGGNSIGF